MATGQVDIKGRIEQAKAKRQWFVDLVRKYETLAQQDPEGYRRKVRLFGALGYVYVFGILILVIAFLVGMVALMFFTGRSNVFEFKGLFFGAIIAYSIIRALFVKFDPPSGLLLTRAEAPHLYREVDSIADKLQAPKPEEIRLDPQLNAAAQQTPRLGIFGWYRNVLHLGMPLLLSLSPDEARSVIAHELGHFSGQHGRFGAWTYRLGMTWSQLYENLHKHGGRGSWLFSGFVNWFVPRFEAMSFALRRAQEYEADRAAVQIAGPVNASRALMRLPYLSSHLDQAFWEPFWNRSKESANLPAHSFAMMPEALKSSPPKEAVHGNLVRAMQEATDYDDTHPSLSDRLGAMQQRPLGDLHEAIDDLAKPVAPSSAEVFFGDSLPGILDRLELHYRPRIEERWQEAHREFQKFQQTLDRLDALRQERALTEEEEVEYLVAVNRTQTPESSEPVLRAMIAKYPENAVAYYLLGEILLEREDASGVEWVERSAVLAPELKDRSRELIAGFYYRKGEREKFEQLREEALEAMTVAELVEEEASRITIKDDFLASDLNADEVADLVTQFEKLPTLQTAYALRKSLPNGAFQHYMVVFPVKKLVETGKEGGELLRLAAKEVTYPRKVLVYTNTQQRKAWERMLASIPGSKIYERGKKV